MHRPALARGLTLVELVTGLSIAALTLVLGLPGLFELVDAQRVRTTAYGLHTAINGARLAAITHGVETVVCPSADGRRCAAGVDFSGGWIVFFDPDGDGERSAGERITTSGAPSHAAVRVTGTRGRSRLRFRPDGFSAGANATLTVCARHSARRLILANSGRLRAESPSPAAAGCPAA